MIRRILSRFSVFKVKIIGFSLLFVLFFILTIFAGHKKRSEDFPERCRQNFEESVQQLQFELQNQMTLFLDGIGSSPSVDQIWKQWFEQDRNENLFLAVLHRDSLVFWSSNTVEFSVPFFEKSRGDPLLKLPNGYFLPEVLQVKDFEFVLLRKIKHEFPYQNDFLKNQLIADFGVPENTDLSLQKGMYNIHAADGRFICSIALPDQIDVSPGESWVLFYFTLALVSLLVLLYQLYFSLSFLADKPIMRFFGFFVDVLIIRYILYYFNFPARLDAALVFSPALYASTAFCSSLAELFINAIMGYAIALVWMRSLRVYKRPIDGGKWKPVGYAVVLMLVVFILFVAFFNLFRSLVFDSGISLNLSDIFQLDGYSYMALAILAFTTAAVMLIGIACVRLVKQLLGRDLQVLLLVTAVALLVLVLPLGWIYFKNLMLLVTWVFVAGTLLILRYDQSFRSFYSLALYLFFWAGISTLVLQDLTIQKEQDHRKQLAVKLAQSRDEVMEFKFLEVEQAVLKDRLLLQKIDQMAADENLEEEVLAYIRKQYFSAYWERFDIQITLCPEGRELQIQPGNYLISCNDYFQGIIESIGKSTYSPHLYFLDEASEDLSYLSIFTFDSLQQYERVRLIVEINTMYIPKGLGYPELLIDQAQYTGMDLENYSYAYYRDGELIRNVGGFLYSTTESVYPVLPEGSSFFNHHGYNHLSFPIGSDTHLIISRKQSDLLSRAAPFSYFLIAFGLFMLLHMVIFEYRLWPLGGLSLKLRLQYSLIAVILFSFLFVGFSSLYFIEELNDRKNNGVLSEKAHSVLIELEHKLASERQLKPEMKERLTGLLLKFSLVFFSDINLYSPDGILLASSRPEIFQGGLLSRRMDALAFHELDRKQQTQFVRKERIGDYEYLSAYLPFRNEQNELVAYLNLPYFARQTELRNEISTFVVAFVNIYVILIALTIFISLIISGYITYPLQLIQTKLGKVRLGSVNEKIEWNRHDEVGRLVEEYNHMVDELMHSATLLARSERESAWREMARQVAHEIKNPLTPMKLSVQYLMRAWNDQAPDMQDRLQRFSDNMVEQIDTLSQIASAFSDFARMPAGRKAPVNLLNTIQKSVGLFRETTVVKLNVEFDQGTEYWVLADKNQLLRVFNNLLKNALQAIGNVSSGQIDIRVNQQDEWFWIEIEDNGPGIPEARREKVFVPNFTTKTSGMGLGLAMVKNIVEGSGGKISFESREGIGTIFRIKLPLCSPDHS